MCQWSNQCSKPTENKNQMIVSKSHHLSSLIIMDTHQHNFHIGREQTLYLLRNIYWIPSCRGLIRKTLNVCIVNVKELKLKQHTCQIYLKTEC